MSILSADNDDIRFEPTLAKKIQKTATVQYLTEAFSWKYFPKCCQKSNVFVVSWQNWHKSAASFACATKSNKNKVQFYQEMTHYCKNLFILVENLICFIFRQFQITFSWSQENGAELHVNVVGVRRSLWSCCSRGCLGWIIGLTTQRRRYRMCEWSRVWVKPMGPI